MFMISIWS